MSTGIRSQIAPKGLHFTSSSEFYKAYSGTCSGYAEDVK